MATAYETTDDDLTERLWRDAFIDSDVLEYLRQKASK